MEILTQKLNRAGKAGGGVMPYWSSLRALEINHILYADDVLLFSNGGKTSFSNLLKVLDDFCANSGQVLQTSKCHLFCSKHIRESRNAELLRISGFSPGKFPIHYLGAPLFHGHPRIRYFQKLADAVQNRIEGWMKSFLSMAGRLTMIKSVLCSIPIHTLSVLNVPKGTIEAIEKMMRSFIWSNSGSPRKHWVKWSTVCSDIQIGGLGIRPLNQMMIALRGKLAWNYLCGDSLWAKYARSRFRIGGPGSSLWKSVSPFISSIAHDCYWRLGRGTTLVSTMCQNTALPFPKRLKSKSIRDVLENNEDRRHFMNNVPPRIHFSLGSGFDDSKEDFLVWSKDPSGIVTTSSFLKSFARTDNPIQKFMVIWQSWIPLKISCFLWKILHSALPSNENVMRAGISMASRCVCCSKSKSESMSHLFIRSDLASILWNFICPLFGKPIPQSVSEIIFDWGIKANFRKYSDVLGFGLVSMCLWEIWKVRCRLIFDGGACNFNKGTILMAASAVSKGVPGKCSHDFKSRVICKSLLISVPIGRDFNVFWRSWRPVAFGNSCNCAFFGTKDKAVISAIIRNYRGFFIHGLKITTTGKHFLKCLLHMISELKMQKIGFVRIQSAQEEIIMLDKNVIVDWKFFQLRKKLVGSLDRVAVNRTSFSLNIPAEALCFSRVESLNTSSYTDLPVAVKRALDFDHIPKPCSRMDQYVFL